MAKHFMTAGLGLTACALLLAGTAVRAQTTPPATTQAKPSGGVGEGIKVHGHWTIEVRNSDGSLASRHEFQNALAANQYGFGGGATILTGALGRQHYIRSWGVEVLGWGICGRPSTGCFMGDPGSDYALHGNLQVSVTNDTLVLRGSATTTVPGSINSVLTYAHVFTCPPPFTGACNAASIRFTGTGLAAPIAVEADQNIQVRVVISFS